MTLLNPIINLTKFITSGVATLTVLTGLSIAISPSQANVITNCSGGNCTLSKLIVPNTFIQVGDKRFDSWGISQNPNNVNLDNIMIDGIFQDTNAPGLQFMVNGNALHVQGGNIVFDFDFKVTSLGEKIKDNTLTLNGYSTTGDSLIDISELVGSSQGLGDIKRKGVTAFGGDTENKTVTEEFDPVQSLWVRKKITMSAIGGGEASLTKFQQRFSQVPEPTSILSLLALGTLGAASTVKRKLKPSQSTEKETTKVG
ncbi:MAG: PEP-CTERM sorting domain-containing protein [Microcystis sp.]|jgi:hypothetical protein|uniref:PEP-CTERM sorting domain-containing protein n=1 Tax=Microcystis sp. TaxID=1127 RepID=UPI0022C13B5E|nr:PEP-CTERM sorting domain-containing protein [Microcystis sp. LE17-20D]MCZ8066286.1 PEP-CTERM sorting domain-containing protein [Microcystis sp. LE17-20D]MCZ8276397.1 PEP-CTERM sorting domain-containing protein [Microcystis sp. LE19-4.1E]